MKTKQTPVEKLLMIESALNNGKTVYIANYLHCWKITAKTLEKWAKAGRQLFKTQGNSLYMAFGRRYDCIDYCSIKVV